MGEKRRIRSLSRRKKPVKPRLGEGGKVVRSLREPKLGRSAGNGTLDGTTSLNAPQSSDGRPFGTDVPTNLGVRLARLLCELPHHGLAPSIDPSSLTVSERLVSLTAREREVLCLYVDRCNAKEVACCLGTRTQTAKNQLAAIEHKLGIDSREELLVFLFSLLDQPRDPVRADFVPVRSAK
jgi:DNA-binding CsgD family transcriptional regulator